MLPDGSESMCSSEVSIHDYCTYLRTGGPASSVAEQCLDQLDDNMRQVEMHSFWTLSSNVRFDIPIDEPPPLMTG